MRSCLLLLVLVPALFASAAEDGSLSLTPAVMMLRGHHGQSTTQTLRITNGTSRPFTFDLVAQDVIVRDGVRTFTEAGAVAGSIAATAVFVPRRVELPPGATGSVAMTVTLPLGTSQRAVVAMFRGTNTVLSGNVPMRASLGALLTFSVSDDVTLAAAPLTVSPQTSSTNLTFVQTCRNDGTEPLLAKGVMAIVDEQGTLVGRAALRPHRFLPGESADLGGDYPGELAPGRYKVLVTYEYEGRSVTDSADVDVR
jgi:hypothetical protein